MTTTPRLPNGRTRFSVIPFDPGKGRPRTYTVFDYQDNETRHGPDTDYLNCVRACHRLSLGEDIFPHEVIQRSVEQMQMALEA